jgi:TatD DNase family protein
MSTFSVVDTHCHLDFNWFDQDREAVILRAREAGLKYILNPGIHLDSSRAAVKLADNHPDIYAACGVHPNDSLSWNSRTRDELRDLAAHPKVKAIGEIGLDYYRNHASPQHQKQVLIEQLSLASELGLPVVLHNRKSTEDMLAILEDWCKDLKISGSPLWERPGVLHAFSEGLEIAQRVIALNFYLGIGGPVTFENAKMLQYTVRELPLDRILIETDAPFLAPHPYRGQRNEPAYVHLVAEKIAEIRQLPLEVVAQQSTINSKRLFNW